MRKKRFVIYDQAVICPYGFTLIELLVGLTIILTIGTMVFSIFVATLRSTNKSINTSTIEKSGSDVLLKISRAVRNAREFHGVSITGEEPFVTTCMQDESSDETVYKAVKVTSFDDVTEIYRCPIGDEKSMYLNNQPLTNTQTTSITEDACSITCTQPTSSSIPAVGIEFTITNAVQTNSPDLDSSRHFQTSVSPRNFTR